MQFMLFKLKYALIYINLLCFCLPSLQYHQMLGTMDMVIIEILTVFPKRTSQKMTMAMMNKVNQLELRYLQYHEQIINSSWSILQEISIRRSGDNRIGTARIPKRTGKK
uniref:Uncharacterized protein n=1 Tax=Schizaphis graminum TaxID=13262 RepID=A0A2S2N704_SCHGA